MDHLRTAIESIASKNASEFKDAVTKELGRKLHDALDRARETVAASSLNRGVAEESIETERDDIQERVESIQEDEWGGGFQGSADAHKQVQSGLKSDFKRDRAKTLKLVVQVIRGEISKEKFKKLAGISYDKVMDPQFSTWYINQVKRMSKKALAPTNPAEGFDTEGDDIQERVEIDGRTRAFRNTVARIEQARKSRVPMKTEEGGNKHAGLYDDGSGRGASVPAPLDINPARFQHITGVNESVEDAVKMGKDGFALKEEDLSPDQKKYRAFFKKALKKFGANSPADLDGEKKKSFFAYVKKHWGGEEE